MSYCLNSNCSRPNSNSMSVKFCTGCGSKLLLAERYRATELLGRGGFGRTFLATVGLDKFFCYILHLRTFRHPLLVSR
jgi:hypothetical protein